MSAPLQLGLNTPHSPALQILDVRHFSAAQLAPLLRDEGRHWEQRLHWDYTQSVNLLLEYLDGRVLPGFVALDHDQHLLGYTFAVYEANKAVIGDVYAFGETVGLHNPVCNALLDSLLEMLEASPGVDRIESQLLMFSAGALTRTFSTRGFRSFPRLFMLAGLDTAAFAQPLPADGSAFRIESWRPEAFQEAAELIHTSYLGHEDAQINDQYQTVIGAERFLHNIIRFPGCGLFDTEHSLLLRDTATGALEGLLLCSRVKPDAAHITQLCLNPRLRGRGLGQRMLLASAQQLRQRGCRELSLTVTENNAKARALYEGLGFATLHRFEAMTWDKR
jgi:ribosomal protein S18 acetylase RimI-like enzyme